MPRTPAALLEHACIMERDGAETELWRFVAAPGRPLLPISIRPRLVVNSAAAAVDSAVAGHGITRVMSYQAAAAVAAGKLIVLLVKYEPPRFPVHLVLPSARSSHDLYPPGASRDPTFGVSGWVSSGGFGNLIGGDSGFAVELSGGADGSSEFMRYYPPMQFRCGTP
jgi:hypothetical protein